MFAKKALFLRLLPKKVDLLPKKVDSVPKIVDSSVSKQKSQQNTIFLAQSKINLYLCTVNLRRGCLYIVSGG